MEVKTIPDYQYCIFNCGGIIKNCPHYEPEGLRRICLHYRLINKRLSGHATINKEGIEKTINEVYEEYKTITGVL